LFVFIATVNSVEAEQKQSAKATPSEQLNTFRPILERGIIEILACVQNSNQCLVLWMIVFCEFEYLTALPNGHEFVAMEGF